MPSISNSVGTVAGFSIKKVGASLYKSSGEIATGRSNYQPTDYIIGSKLEDNSKILDSVARGVAYGSNLLTSAQSQLISIGTQLNKLQTLIIQANSSSSEVLAQLNLLYQDGVKDIIQKLEKASFDGRKLFDGSLANLGNAPVVASENLPLGAESLNIRAGEAMTNIISLCIPRLLSGDGSSIDRPVTGRFTPLFPVELRSGADAVVVRDQIASNIARDYEQAIEAARARNDEGRASIRDIVGVINPPPIGANPGTVASINSALAVVAGAIAASERHPPNLIQAVSNVVTSAAQDLEAEAISTGTAILSAIVAAVVIDRDNIHNIQAVIDAIDAIHFPPDSSNIVKSVYAAAKAVRDIANAVIHPSVINNAGENTIDQASVINAIVDGAKAAANVQIAISIKSVIAANILTKRDQEAATQTISNALAIVNNLVIEIGAKTQQLRSAFDSINNSIKVQHEAANQYLVTNYEEAAKRFKLSLLAMRGCISIISQNYSVSDAVLELIK